MKKYLISSCVLSVLLSGVAYAEVIPNSTRDEVKQQINQEREDLKNKISSTSEKIKTLREEIRDEIEIKIGKKLDDQKNKIAKEFEIALRNLNNFITRTESRISKLDANKIDTTEAKVLLATAKTKVLAAQTEVTNLENLLAQNIPSVASSTQKEIRKTVLQSIKVQSEKTKTAIKAAQKAIVDVINSLKPGQNRLDKASSTKEENSTSTR